MAPLTLVVTVENAGDWLIAECERLVRAGRAEWVDEPLSVNSPARVRAPRWEPPRREEPPLPANQIDLAGLMRETNVGGGRVGE